MIARIGLSLALMALVGAIMVAACLWPVATLAWATLAVADGLGFGRVASRASR